MSWRSYHIFQGLTLTGWGGFIIEKIWSGKIALLINQRFTLLILAAALMFGVTSLAVFISLTRSRKAAIHPDGIDKPAVETEMNTPPVMGLLILLIPLLLGLLISPRPLGSSVVAYRGMNTTAPLGNFHNSTFSSLSLSSTERSVLDWVGDFNAISDPSSFAGQAANVTGFVYHDPRLGKDQFLVSRFVVVCCVADASALGMVVDWPGADQLPSNRWVNVQGTITVGELGGQKIPGIHAQTVDPIPTPDQPYLSPK